MRFELYDTNGHARFILAPITQDEMRLHLAAFKTECRIMGKEYEYNHFKNWMAKHHGIMLSPEEMSTSRVDM